MEAATGPDMVRDLARGLSELRAEFRGAFPGLEGSPIELGGAGVAEELGAGGRPAARALGSGPAGVSVMAPKAVRDGTWGDSALLELGAWCLGEGAGRRELASLYAASFSALDPLPPAHVVHCPAWRPDLVEAWFRLGFGLEQVYAAAPLGAIRAESPDPAGVRIRRSDAGDREILRALSPVLASSQAGAPAWAGAPASYLASLAQGFADLAADEEAIVLLALDGDKALGYQAWFPAAKGDFEACVELGVAATLPEARGRGVGLALTRAGIEAARGAGYRSCRCDWRSANPLASGFWEGRGFKPFMYRLCRRLSPQALERAR